MITHHGGAYFDAETDARLASRATYRNELHATAQTSAFMVLKGGEAEMHFLVGSGGTAHVSIDPEWPVFWFAINPSYSGSLTMRAPVPGVFTVYDAEALDFSEPIQVDDNDLGLVLSGGQLIYINFQPA